MKASGNHPWLGRLLRILLALIIVGGAPAMQVSALAQKAAAGGGKAYLPAIGKGQMEWTLHKTADNLHPDGSEQQMMWLMNRARANPTKEGVWLATTTQSDIAFPRSYFDVNLAVLKSEFASYAPKPPAAFDARLYAAAKEHSDYMIATDSQTHTGQFESVKATGYRFSHIRGNIFAYSDNGLSAHAAFNIDWTDTTSDGMQTGRGHRQAIMSLDDDYYGNVGIAMVPVTVPNKHVGPLVTTGNYAHPYPNTPNEYNRFIVGTVWQDRNGNGLYDPGEGYGNVSVWVDGNEYYAVTANSGGYAVPILAPGTYTVRFSGIVSGVKQVVVGASSVLLDLQAPASAAAPAPGPAAAAPDHAPAEPPPGIGE